LSYQAQETIDDLTDVLHPHADRLGITPGLLAIALAARIAGATNRTAMRVARMVLSRLPANVVAEVVRELGRDP